jgi:hypothetical protein
MGLRPAPAPGHGANPDWDRLLARFADQCPVLLSHLVLFRFVYPDRRDDIPSAVIRE